MDITTLRYAHEIEPHPGEGEALPLDRLVRYHYAQAQAWHLSFADAINSRDFDFPLSRYLGHAHLAFLHDALAQGLSGQEAADWASVRNHSESAELVWERAAAHGLDPDAIRPYSSKRKSPEPDDHHAIDVDECGHDWQPVNTSRGRAYQCERCFDRTD